ncbi:MAG: hypothetical protein QW815_07030 [Nitrososphaerota archaeon]
MNKSRQTENLGEISRSFAEDQVYKYLLRNSNLTRKQAETLIYDLVTSQGVKLSAREKASLRGVSKGAFVRTRHTLLLLSYLGIMRLPSYDWFFQLGEAAEEKDAEKLRSMLEDLSGVMR